MEKFLEVKNLRVSYHSYAGEVQSVRGVSFSIDAGQSVAIVGESGCGKSVTAKTIMGLIQTPPGEIKEGSQILFEGRDILSQTPEQWQEYRGKDCAIIFQDALAALNPTMTIGNQVAEKLLIHTSMSRAEAWEEAGRLLKLVGIPNPEKRMKQYPHEFSGGQRQRIGIARTLAVEPEFIVCDEPISALDVSIQAQIVNLFGELKEKLGLTYLFIAHDLSMVRHISDRVGVMYLGMMAEMADSRELYENPRHPYTKALLSAIPSTDPDQPMSGRRIRMEGEVGSPVNPPAGCRFASRCPWATDRCRKEMPMLRQVAPGHFCACHLEESQGT